MITEIRNDCIEIYETDMPIEVASKLINATVSRPYTDMEKALIKAFRKHEPSGCKDEDMFTDEDLMEIAHHLLLHCKGVSE